MVIGRGQTYQVNMQIYSSRILRLKRESVIPIRGIVHGRWSRVDNINKKERHRELVKNR